MTSPEEHDATGYPPDLPAAPATWPRLAADGTRARWDPAQPPGRFTTGEVTARFVLEAHRKLDQVAYGQQIGGQPVEHLAGDLHASATDAPSLASTIAVSSPSPLFAPVTSAR